LTREKIENALGIPVTATMPFVQDVFVDAINLGQPPIFHKPELNVSGLLEDFAFFMSKDAQKKSKPDNPTEAWLRVYKRYRAKKR
jgi:Flp pilus assembly CpaE family ATPase